MLSRVQVADDRCSGFLNINPDRFSLSGRQYACSKTTFPDTDRFLEKQLTHVLSGAPLLISWDCCFRMLTHRVVRANSSKSKQAAFVAETCVLWPGMTEDLFAEDL